LQERADEIKRKADADHAAAVAAQQQRQIEAEEQLRRQQDEAARIAAEQQRAAQEAEQRRRLEEQRRQAAEAAAAAAAALEEAKRAAAAHEVERQRLAALTTSQRPQQTGGGPLGVSTTDMPPVSGRRTSQTDLSPTNLMPEQMDAQHTAMVVAEVERLRRSVPLPYTDPSFRGLEAIKGTDVERELTEADFRRLQELVVSPVLRDKEGFNAGDIQQGDLGDCWFLSALSVMTTLFTLMCKCLYDLQAGRSES
jgi:hypothetical protein